MAKAAWVRIPPFAFFFTTPKGGKIVGVAQDQYHLRIYQKKNTRAGNRTPSRAGGGLEPPRGPGVASNPDQWGEGPLS